MKYLWSLLGIVGACLILKCLYGKVTSDRDLPKVGALKMEKYRMYDCLQWKAESPDHAVTMNFYSFSQSAPYAEKEMEIFDLQKLREIFLAAEEIYLNQAGPESYRIVCDSANNPICVIGWNDHENSLDYSVVQVVQKVHDDGMVTVQVKGGSFGVASNFASEWIRITPKVYPDEDPRFNQEEELQ